MTLSVVPCRGRAPQQAAVLQQKQNIPVWTHFCSDPGGRGCTLHSGGHPPAPAPWELRGAGSTGSRQGRPSGGMQTFRKAEAEVRPLHPHSGPFSSPAPLAWAQLSCLQPPQGSPPAAGSSIPPSATLLCTLQHCASCSRQKAPSWCR